MTRRSDARGRAQNDVLQGADRRVLVFGFLLTLLSGFGQTFFIGLFSTELRDRLALTPVAFGTVYSVATLVSAACLFRAGALIDRIPVARYAFGSACFLSVGYILLTLARDVFWLAMALFLLRFAGQGLLPHTAVTSIARVFHRARGKALSIVLLGHPAGEALLPPAAVMIAASAGWRVVWLVAAGVLLAAGPLLAGLCAESGLHHKARRVGVTGTARGDSPSADKSRSEVLRDSRFYLLLPVLFLPSFVLTGVFIHQGPLVEEKGWEASWFASSFVGFAGAQVLGMLGIGRLIDRFNAKRLMPFYLLPLGLACIVINISDHRLVAMLFMVGGGFTIGTASAIVTAMWAELYGVSHLGAIRVLGASVMIVSTALAPPIFGWLLENGIALGSILIVCAASIAGAMLLGLVAMKARPWQRRLLKS